MKSETFSQWWRQLGAMSQGMLFLHGHSAGTEAPAAESRQRESHVHDATGQRRHERAVRRLNARRLRTTTSLSLFR